MGKKLIDWRVLTLELLTVVLGILMAFALNNFNENRKAKNEAALQLHRIEQEVISNKEHIEERYTYHQNLLRDLQEKPDSISLILRLSHPVDYAWNVAQNSTFKTLVDYDKIVILEKIYSYQERLNINNLSVGDHMNYANILGPDYVLATGSVENAQKFYSDKQFQIYRKRSWIPIFQDIAAYEKALIQSYEAFLELST